jgi:hypothetical protein
MTEMVVHLPEALKAKLDAKRTEGYTISGFVRTVLEKELNEPQPAAMRGQKGR